MVEVKINIPSLLSPLALEAIKTKLNDNIQLWKSVKKEATTSLLHKAIDAEIHALKAQLDNFTGSRPLEVGHE